MSGIGSCGTRGGEEAAESGEETPLAVSAVGSSMVVSADAPIMKKITFKSSFPKLIFEILFTCFNDCALSQT